MLLDEPGFPKKNPSEGATSQHRAAPALDEILRASSMAKFCRRIKQKIPTMTRFQTTDAATAIAIAFLRRGATSFPTRGEVIRPNNPQIWYIKPTDGFEACGKVFPHYCMADEEKTGDCQTIAAYFRIENPKISNDRQIGRVHGQASNRFAVGKTTINEDTRIAFSRGSAGAFLYCCPSSIGSHSQFHSSPIHVTPEMEALQKDLVRITNVFADHLAEKTPISADDLEKACSVLRRFTESKDFSDAITASLTGQNGTQPDLKTDFVAFINQFLTPEARLLKTSGVNDRAIDQILSGAVEVRQEMDQDVSADGILGDVNKFQELVCRAATDAQRSKDQRRISALFEGVGATVLIVVDIVGGEETEGLSGRSLKFGWRRLSHAIDNLFMSH